MVKKILGALLFVFLINSCETNDVKSRVIVSLSAAQMSISEDSGMVVIQAALNSSDHQGVSIDLWTSGTALKDVDYYMSENYMFITPGDLTTSITLYSIQDSIEEGNESAEIGILSVSGADKDGEEKVLVLIEDDDTAPVEKLIVNEICYDPSNSGLDGDANGDGVYSQAEDEFIEFINFSSQSMDLSGYKIYDNSALASEIPRHVIPANTIIPAGGVLLVFGGGTPTGTFGGSIVQISSTGNMNLSNAGDIMTLKDVAGVEVVSFDITPFSGNPNESYTRNPDLIGDFEQHSANTSLKFSPGTKLDGSPF
ncbi:MAG: Uncharacterised protein [Owenweeksia sp. TMED14]|nr:MAG: Uncharacterised protein [Owenweeksia sp. TMED14]|tara:strand:- start:2284 stop:3216 length:933 start_codon:yes stop_codon:yes gene_type:complete